MSFDLLLLSTAPEPSLPIDRAAFAEAVALIADYGDHAGLEAASRANRSRSLGNVIHFCRWRQIERTIAMLGEGDVTGTVH